MTKARDLANAADVLDDVSSTELSYVNGVTSAIQTQLNNKQAVVSGVNDTEIGYLDGVTSAIQTQLDAKVAKSLVDAKGDLLVGSANDTVSRLAAASTAGYVLTVDSAETTGLKWAAAASSFSPNAVINGGMDIWQRGTSFTPLANATTFGPDRWGLYRDPGSGATVSRETSGLTNFLYCARVARNSGNTSTGSIIIYQNFESQMTYPYAGKTVVISYYARAGANFSPTSSNITVQLYTGTGTDQNVLGTYTGSTLALETTQAITTTWTRYSHTVTLSSSATEMALRFLMTPTGTAGAADYFEITGVQLEPGSVATTFTRSGGTIQGELAACQRYYYLAVSGTSYPVMNMSFYTTTSANGVIPFKNTMRTTPTLSSTTGTNYYSVTVNSNERQFTTVNFDFAGTDSANLYVNPGTTETTGSGCALRTKNASSFIAFSAEL